MKDYYYFIETNEKHKINRLYDVLNEFIIQEEIDVVYMSQLLKQILEEQEWKLL